MIVLAAEDFADVGSFINECFCWGDACAVVVEFFRFGRFAAASEAPAASLPVDMLACDLGQGSVDFGGPPAHFLSWNSPVFIASLMADADGEGPA